MPGKIVHGHNRTGKRTPEYLAWDNMIARCYRPRHESYKNYGARGIRVCLKWRHSFVSFLRDMKKRPSVRHTLDRRDGTKNYTPSNCRWATRRQQNLNRRLHRKNKPGKHAKFVTFNKGAFIAHVTVLGTRKQKYLGRFRTEIEAVKAAREELCLQKS